MLCTVARKEIDISLLDQIFLLFICMLSVYFDTAIAIPAKWVVVIFMTSRINAVAEDYSECAC